MKTQLISSISSFVLGTGVTLASLLAWTGTSDLQAIRSAVQDYIVESEQHSSALVEDYQVTVENANAEIGEYKDALALANDNISQLITAYQQAEEQHQQELENANQQAEQDLADLQAELDKLYVRMDSKYRTDMNAIIDQANEQINSANEEVGETKENVLKDLQSSQVDEYVEQAKQLKDQLDTTGDKSVTSIESIVPSEQPQE